MTIIHAHADTPMGTFSWLRGEGGILASGWTSDPDYLVDLARLDETVRPGTDEDTRSAVVAFFAGRAGALDGVRVDQRGGEFIEAGWAALSRIPVGSTRTYTELAADAGRPAAVRAAASACATNRCALFVPCHRVVRSDGSLGGFRYGLAVKGALLAHERDLVAA